MKEVDREESTVDNLIDNALDKIKCLMDCNIIVGEPVISPSGNIIIPISKVAVGFVSGGGEYADNSRKKVANHYPMAGGTCGGMSVTPVGFLYESDGEIKYIDIENKSAYQTILNLVNKIMEQFDKKQGEQEWKNILRLFLH